MTLNSFYGSIDLSIRAVFRRIFFLDTAFLIEKVVMIFIKVLKNIGSMSNNVGDNLNQ